MTTEEQLRARVAQLEEALRHVRNYVGACIGKATRVTESPWDMWPHIEAALSTPPDSWLADRLARHGAAVQAEENAAHDAEVRAQARREALEEAARYVDLNWTLDRPEGGYLRTPAGDRARRIAAELRALVTSSEPTPHPLAGRTNYAAAFASIGQPREPKPCATCGRGGPDTIGEVWNEGEERWVPCPDCR